MRKRLSDLSERSMRRYLRTLKEAASSSISTSLIETQRNSEEENESLHMSNDNDLISDNIEHDTSDDAAESIDTTDEGNNDEEDIDDENNDYENNFKENEDEDSVKSDDNSDGSSISENMSDEDFNVSENEIEDNEFYNQPLYTGATITIQDSMLLIQTLILRNKLNNTCVEDIFELVELHCPQNNFKKLSFYRLQQLFKNGNNSTKKHYYCANCHTPLEENFNLCKNCGDKHETKYFLEISLTNQIKNIFSVPENYEALYNRFNRRKIDNNNFEDFCDGSVYQNHHEFLSHKKHISLTWCSDGVSPFKSSKLSVWPFYLRINELPYDSRKLRKNTVLAALWFGKEKPSPNIFLSPLADELEKLSTGISIKVAGTNQCIEIRGILISGTCDLPAKSLFLNMNLYNGEFGCCHCEIPTKTYQSAGKSWRIFNYEENLITRTLKNTISVVFEIMQKRSTLNNAISVRGMKGPSILCQFMPDYIQGMAIDSMHAVFEGVVKKLLTLWIDASHSTHSWSIRSMIRVIDVHLLKIKPPKFIHRMPRSIDTWNTWKASELKCWFFYYSPVILSEIMRPEYFQHYMLLVSGIALLYRSSISQEQTGIAEECLTAFVKGFEHYYDRRFCSINIHLLLHLSEEVRKFGPLWTHSCFTFESINGELMRTIHGTKNVDSQIARSHIQFLNYHSKLSQLTPGPILHFASKRKKQVNITLRTNDFCVVGGYSKMENVPQLLEEWMDAMHVNNHFTLQKYLRLLKSKQLFISAEYERQMQTDSSYICYNYNTIENIGRVLYFIKKKTCSCADDICFCDNENFAIIRKINSEENYSNFLSNINYLSRCLISDEIIVVPISALVTVVFCLEISDKLYIAKPVNFFEIE